MVDEADFLHAAPECLLPPEAWVNKKERFRCYVCAQKFNNLFRRRHHCRLCGELFCKQCIVHKFVSIAGREKVSVKVCTPCAYEDVHRAKRHSPLYRSSRRLLQMSDEEAARELLNSPVTSAADMTFDDTHGDLDFEESFYQGRFECPPPPFAPDEVERLTAVNDLQILNTPPDKTFNVICELAATSLHCPMAVISFMDHERQWFKAKIGWSKNYLLRRVSFCAHAILTTAPTVVLDTRADPRFVKNPLVVDYGVRFYASVPLVTSLNWVVGTLAVFDYQAHPACDVSSLIPLARGIMKQIEEERTMERVQRRRQAASFDERSLSPPSASFMRPHLSSRGNVEPLPENDTIQTQAQLAANGNMETILFDLLHKTSETQQQLATQQGTMFATLGHHSKQIGKLTEAVARMESKLSSPVAKA
ncbi:hypothetical protein AC1031_018516 [Aphanomyces cochlioides]|nr:hypothetical protein AC1031_018516 [Aphanomyces cochlioides]